MLRILTRAAPFLLAALLLVQPHGRHAKADIGDIVSDFLYYEEELKIKNPANPVARVLPDMGGRYLGFADVAGVVRIWDFETGRESSVDEPWPDRVRSVFSNRRSANLIVVEKTGRIYETAGFSFAAKSVLLENGQAADAVAVSTAGPIVVGAQGLQLHVYNLETRRKRTYPVRNYPAKGLITHLAVSPDGRYIAYRTDDSLSVLDTDRRASVPVEFVPDIARLEFYSRPDGGLGLAQLSRGGRVGFYRFNGRAFSPSGARQLGGGVRRVWIRSDRELYWTENDGVLRAASEAGDAAVVYRSKEPIAHIEAISATGDLLVLHRNSVFKVFSTKLKKTVAAGISTRNGWAVIDANKRYDGSQEGSKDIAWVVQELDLELEKFARQFYEPGLLLHYVTQLSLGFAVSGTTGKIPVPPRISEMKFLENVAGSGRSVVFATAQNIRADIANIEIYLNGKKIPESRKMVDQRFEKDEIKVRSIAYEIRPTEGPNVVSVVGVGELGVEGPTRELSIQRPGRLSNELHLVAIGIDRYQAPELTLGYAKQDAAAISRMMRSRSGFEKLIASELYDADATRERIVESLRTAARKSKSGDTILIYLAGHGIALGNSWYFLSPSVARVTEAEIVEKSVTAEQIARALRETRARNIVLLIDTCNSGAVVKDIKGLLQYRVYNRISRELGVAVLAASRRDQNALERDTLGHGVFTATMIAALSGGADRNGDRRITARELAAFAARQIPTLAIEHLNEIQIPLAYAPSNDFVIRTLP